MEKEEIIWELPVHRGLVQPVFWGGVPRMVLISEMMFAILGGAIFKTFMVIPVMICVHLIFRYFSQSDPHFADVFFNSLHYEEFYKG